LELLQSQEREKEKRKRTRRPGRQGIKEKKRKEQGCRVGSDAGRKPRKGVRAKAKK